MAEVHPVLLGKSQQTPPECAVIEIFIFESILWVNGWYSLLLLVFPNPSKDSVRLRSDAGKAY